MTKDKIKKHAGGFIEAAGLTEWNQEAHNAFVAYVLKRELVASNALAKDMTGPVIDCLMACQQAMPALTANASAFRQWLESKDVALLEKQAAARENENRYAGLV